MTKPSLLAALFLALCAVTQADAQTTYSEKDWNELRLLLSLNSTAFAPTTKGANSPAPGHPAGSASSRILTGHADTVHRFACAMGVPPDLSLALAEQESNFRPSIGRDGELGILQVLPATADQYRLDRSRLMEPEYGTYAGLTILLELLRVVPETEAIASYNAGSGYRLRPRPEIVEKVDRYVSQVLARKQKYRGIGCRVLTLSLIKATNPA